MAFRLGLNTLKEHRIRGGGRSDCIAKQLSCSFGFLPPDPSSDELIFQEFAAQGLDSTAGAP